MTHPVFELRQYLLHPTRREALIELFDREFIETQEACGMQVIGQFRDLDRPDHFVWLRGFASFAERAPALERFYDGPVWHQFRDAANATMISSDDVLMLRPAWEGAADGLRNGARPGIGEQPTASRIDVTVRPVPRDEMAAFTERFRQTGRKEFETDGMDLIAALVSEHGENAFPRLPVRQGESVFVAITRSEAGNDSGRAAGERLVPGLMSGASPEEPQHLRLAPTARSRLR